MRVTVPILAPLTPAVPLTIWESNVFRFLCRVAADPSQSCSNSVELRVAGGWVRDKLLSRPTGDIDIAVRHITGVQFAENVHNYAQNHVSSSSEQCYIPSATAIARIAANPCMSRHLETAAVRIDGNDLDFVQLRTEDYASTANHRVPVSVAIGTPEEDARRRDFTVNALFYNLHTKSVEDFTKMGLDDLAKGVLRTPLSSEITLLEDPLRSLRALRFACKLGFDMHSELQQALGMDELHDTLMRKVSRERIGVEISQIVQSTDVQRGLELIDTFSLVDAVFLHTFSDGTVPGAGSMRYREGLARVEQVLDMWTMHKMNISEKERVAFQAYGRTVLIFTSLAWDINRLDHMLSKALRREKRLVQDGRRLLLLSVELEERVKNWQESRKRRDLTAEREAWSRIAEIIHFAGEHLWISVVLCAGLRLQDMDLLAKLVESGIGRSICKETPLVNGSILRDELGLATGPEVGQALKGLLRLQLMDHHRGPFEEKKGNNQQDERISAQNCIQILKERGYLAEKVGR